MSKLWINNPTVLINKYSTILPSPDMNMTEKLNAMARLSIYMIIFLIIFKAKQKWFYIPGVMLLLTILLNKSDNKTNIKQSIKNSIKDTFKNTLEDTINDAVVKSFKKCNKTYRKRLNSKKALEYDFDKHLYDTKQIDNLYAEVERNMDIDKQVRCKEPTNDNPMMNPCPCDTATDKPVPAACNSFDEDIHNEMQDKVNYNLFRNLTDVYDRTGAQLHFYPVAGREKPNDQKAFAQWLYNNGPTCKEDQEQCLRYEDLRYGNRLFDADYHGCGNVNTIIN